MGPLPGSGHGFIAWVRNNFGTEMVTVIHQSDQGTEERTELEAQVQSKAAFFDVDVPVYEGDRLEIPDPRGGVQRVYITDVEVNRAGGLMRADMSHIKATFSTSAPQSNPPGGHSGTVIYGDHAIVASGSRVAIATQGGRVVQHEEVPAAFTELVAAVQGALDLLESADYFGPDDQEIGRDAGSVILQEVIKEEPDQKSLKGALATLRGVLTAGMTSASGAVASEITKQLFVPGS
ncbi:hypothetical protein [Glutamicibacter ardleyensis]|uniref:hypothetical protein n=1 Tax=Glutamicibacter ardleyensis TaxID=225894 RepID=UPI003FD45DD3